MNEWLGLQDVADMTGLTIRTVYMYHSVGRLPPHDATIAGKKVWAWSTIRDWDDTRNRRNT